MAAKTAPAKKPAAKKPSTTPRKPRTHSPKKPKVTGPEPTDWLESLVFAEKHGTISDVGKDTLKRVRAKAKTGSKADASTLRIAEENAAA
jgi:hypothetical protein